MNILVVAAHPDDEILGLGGTLAVHVRDGHRVFPVIVASGEQVRYAEDQDTRLHDACRSACAELGLEEPRFLKFPDQRLDASPQIELTRAIEQLVAEHEPEVVYMHHLGDINMDHRVLGEATLVAVRPKPGACVKRVFAFHTPSSTDWAPASHERAFLPNWFVDISETFEQKLRALAHYTSEVPPFPHPRSVEAIRAQARYWGSGVGVQLAEPFVLVRHIAGG